MKVEELKARLRSLLHQRDMLAYERDSLELFDLMEDVDHIIPHRGDQKLFWDRNNWQALCKPCHDRKTGKEDRKVVYHY